MKTFFFFLGGVGWDDRKSTLGIYKIGLMKDSKADDSVRLLPLLVSHSLQYNLLPFAPTCDLEIFCQVIVWLLFFKLKLP